MYRANLPILRTSGSLPLLAATVLVAFSGAFLGNRLLKKVTHRGIQILVSLMLLEISLGLALGLI